SWRAARSSRSGRLGAPGSWRSASGCRPTCRSPNRHRASTNSTRRTTRTRATKKRKTRTTRKTRSCCDQPLRIRLLRCDVLLQGKAAASQVREVPRTCGVLPQVPTAGPPGNRPDPEALLPPGAAVGRQKLFSKKLIFSLYFCHDKG